MQTITSLQYKTRSDLVRLMYFLTFCVFIVEVAILVVKYPLGILSCTVPRYILRYIIMISSWNLIMCRLISAIIRSRRIKDNQKNYMIVFCVVKMCAAIAIIHSHNISTQCIFISAIMAAALLGDTKLIIFALADSIFMLSISVLLTPLFNQTLSFEQQIDTLIVSMLILCFTSMFAHIMVKNRNRSYDTLERYIENLEKANKEAKLDVMTGLYNHAEFYNMLHKEMSKKGNQIIVAITDIDHFKHINDSYGHDNGDKVILKIAEYAREINNDKNIFASRYGGEEFSFIFINIPRKDVINKLEHIRSAISSNKFDFDEEKVITMSCGLFECTTANCVAEDVFSNADLALYYSKENGRNQLNVYNDLSKDDIDKLSIKH